MGIRSAFFFCDVSDERMDNPTGDKLFDATTVHLNTQVIIGMESKRQQKVARQIQKDLGEIFQRDVPHLFNGAFITVTSVRVSPDLSVARVYLSFLATKNKEMLLDSIREKSRTIRQLLGERVRHQLRIVPDLSFYIDDTAEYAEKMDKLFAGLDIPPAPEEDEDE